MNPYIVAQRLAEINTMEANMIERIPSDQMEEFFQDLDALRTMAATDMFSEEV